MFRFLLRPRWIALTVFALLFVPTCVALGQWQLDRYHLRHDENRLVHHNMSAAAVPVSRLTGPDRELAKSDRWRSVSATGSYDAAHQLLVRNRSQDGMPGFYVLTPLVQADGAAVVVNRGWIPVGNSDTAHPVVPAPPSGTVTVTGRVRPAETPGNSGRKNRSGAPEGQVYLVDTHLIGDRVPYPVHRAYVELVGQRPAAGAEDPDPVPPPPDQDEGMNLSYFVQWNLFAGIGVATWFVLAWRETRAYRRRDTEHDTGHDTGHEASRDVAGSVDGGPEDLNGSPHRPAAAAR